MLSVTRKNGVARYGAKKEPCSQIELKSRPIGAQPVAIRVRGINPICARQVRAEWWRGAPATAIVGIVSTGGGHHDLLRSSRRPLKDFRGAASAGLTCAGMSPRRAASVLFGAGSWSKCQEPGKPRPGRHRDRQSMTANIDNISNARTAAGFPTESPSTRASMTMKPSQRHYRPVAAQSRLCTGRTGQWIELNRLVIAGD